MLRWVFPAMFLFGGVAGPAAAHELLHHDLAVRLDPASAGVEVVDRIRLAASDGPLNFLLHRDLELTGARLDGTALEVRTLRRWRPRDFFEQPDYAELGGFAVARQHELAAPGGGWPAGEIEIELTYAGAVYDSLRAPEVAYGRGFETTTGIVDARGAYLAGESFWVPWTGEGRFGFRLATDLPAPWHSMSQGRRVQHGSAAGRNRTVWESEAPQELVYLVAGPWVIREREHRGVNLYTYTFEDTPAELCETYLGAAGRYLDRYGASIAPYPFSKWALVENWWQTGYGMPGFTLLGDRVIRLPFIVDTSYGHEILHCWWGNGVYVDRSHGNWCEGLTAYQADYAYKLEEGADAARDYRRNALTAYLDFASSADRDFPLREFRERNDFGTQAIGYGKCMMVFHMLETLVGTPRFDAALRAFYQEHQFAAASWDDLAAAFGAAANADLSAWFEAWVGRPGAARIAIRSLETDGDAWTLRVGQDGSPFPLQVPVAWTTAAGAADTLLALTGAQAELRLPAGLRSVAVDPDYRVFREVYRDEIPATLSQGLGADSTLVVIGRDAPEALRVALREVATAWGENQNLDVIDESEFDADAARGRSLFLLGPGPMVDATFADAAPVYGSAPADLRTAASHQSLVACFRDPSDPELARVVVLPENPEAVAALGRKIPHYSRYSWLTFEGEQNSGKGAWTVLSSPLRRTLEESR